MTHDQDPTLAPGHDNTLVAGLDFHKPVFPRSALAFFGDGGWYAAAQRLDVVG
ncbi:hypothetical protein [Aquisalimonas sp.]|uniref:hypothetical protein n=1 Tax=Aquisalimonas sp. TaxID=1872621 RepID=UPI0025C154CA|nr:hypothetical protein [Aquisalimonas sp.]